MTLNISIEIRIAASGMAWKGEESEAVTALSSQDIKWAQWIRVARNYQLRVGLKDRTRETFDGFTREVCHSSLRISLENVISINIEFVRITTGSLNF